MAIATQPDLADEPAAVMILDDGVLFQGFIEPDLQVMRTLQAAEDIEAAAHQLLMLGARATSFVASTTETESIEARLASMTEDVETAVGGALSQLHDATRGLLDADDGELVRLLTQFSGELAAMLDPARRDSAAAAWGTALRTIMEKALEAHSRQVRRLVDPDAEDGPVGRVVGLIRDHTGVLSEEVRRLAEVLTADRARAEGLDRSGLKGAPYEETVFGVVAEIAALQGDAAEHVGLVKGSAGSLKGDVVVNLNPADVCGRSASYALETKTGKERLRATLEYLDQVMANRGSSAAVAVFAGPELAPCNVPFQPFDNRALVVFDRADLDDHALRLACLWARWVVRRQLAEGASGLDVERMEAAIDRARRALERVSTIRRAHSTATKAIGEARGQVDDLIAEVEAALRTLTEELGE